MKRQAGPEIERLIQLLARLPGLGPRSARRAVLHLIKNREKLLDPLTRALEDAQATVEVCSQCGNVDSINPCSVCTDPRRDQTMICVVEEVGDLWALERANAWHGLYHVLGGTLSALGGVTPEDLSIGQLVQRASNGTVREVVTRLLRRFEREGWISQSREHINIVDAAALRAICNPEPILS